MNDLRFMPGSLRDQAGCERIELKLDAMLLVPRMRTEASPQQFSDREISWTMEAGAGQADIAHARQSEGAQLSATEVVPKEVPLILQAGEVVWAKQTQFELATLQLAIVEIDLNRTQNGLADSFESLQMSRTGSGTAEGDDFIEV